MADAFIDVEADQLDHVAGRLAARSGRWVSPGARARSQSSGRLRRAPASRASLAQLHGGIGIDTTSSLFRCFLWAKHNARLGFGLGATGTPLTQLRAPGTDQVCLDYFGHHDPDLACQPTSATRSHRSDDPVAGIADRRKARSRRVTSCPCSTIPSSPTKKQGPPNMFMNIRATNWAVRALPDRLGRLPKRW